MPFKLCRKRSGRRNDFQAVVWSPTSVVAKYFILSKMATKKERREKKKGGKRKESAWNRHVKAFAHAHKGKKFGKGGLFKEARKTYHKK